jgi:hypothetical protein
MDVDGGNGEYDFGIFDVFGNRWINRVGSDWIRTMDV